MYSFSSTRPNDLVDCHFAAPYRGGDVPTQGLVNNVWTIHADGDARGAQPAAVKRISNELISNSVVGACFLPNYECLHFPAQQLQFQPLIPRKELGLVPG
jgi:hypothetical protein